MYDRTIEFVNFQPYLPHITHASPTHVTMPQTISETAIISVSGRFIILEHVANDFNLQWYV
jgi:hypothetical protein